MLKDDDDFGIVVFKTSMSIEEEEEEEDADHMLQDHMLKGRGRGRGIHNLSDCPSSS